MRLGGKMWSSKILPLAIEIILDLITHVFQDKYLVKFPKMLNILTTDNTLAEWLAFLPHFKEVPGLILGLCKPFCFEFTLMSGSGSPVDALASMVLD